MSINVHCGTQRNDTLASMDALSFFTSMQDAMDKQAADVWNMVEYSRSDGYQLRLGEVTTTELNFYRLREYWTKGVYIRTNEPDEPSTGADWEWVIGRGKQWLQIRVQAKIIDRDGKFAHLGHKPHGASRQQIETLIKPPSTDVVCRWMPLYVFYTATPPASQPFDPRTGCSARLARHVKADYRPSGKRATLKAGNLLPGSIRWSSIFDGLVTRLKAKEQLDDIIDSLSNKPLPDTMKSIDEFWDRTVSDGICHQGLPEYLRAIFERRDDDFNDARLATLEVISTAPRDLPRSVGGRGEQGDGVPTIARGDDEFAPLPARSIRLDRPRSQEEDSPLPHFVSVIDIDRLPDVPLERDK